MAASDHTLLNLAFVALCKLATPSLLKHAWRLPQDEQLEHAQEILMRVYAAAKKGGTAIDYAEVNFNAYLKYRSIDRLRERNDDFEVVSRRINPTDNHDPLNTVLAREPSLEGRVLLQIAIAGLQPKLKEVFLQFHFLKLTQAEIARQYDVDTPVSSIGPETHAKQPALSYAFDLWRVFQQCCQGIAATFCSKSSRGGSFWIVDTGTSSGTYIVLKNHCFSTPNASFQNRSFSGLMTP